VLYFCENEVHDWEPRLGPKKQPLEGTRRKNFGVQAKYEKSTRNPVTELPEVLVKLGERVLKDCKEWANEWRTSCTDIQAMPKFEQAYVQRYIPGETLGFHFDERPGFCEAICGVTICGEGSLLLSSTNGTGEVTDKMKRWDNVATVKLPPLSLYVITGMSRFDLRHAAVQEGEEERISVTFRSQPQDIKHWVAKSRARVKAKFAQ